MVSSNAELENIIKGCVSEKQRQKEALYKSYYGYIKGVVLRYVQDYHTAEELVNDSFVKIFSHLDTFHGTSESADLCVSFKSWIAKIASRTAIDSLRRKKINFGVEEINENHTPHLLRSNPAENSEGRDILALLNKLPQTQKTVFNLYEIEGFSHEEIAGMLAIPVNVCRVYLSRAKTKLKALYVKNI
ncbi:MAG: RNA polymerase [Sphingobacteriales bacterium 41-5]|nr:MAG: RNA polymerase [Sphingobacteriales bacterium 41-5]